MIAEGKRDNGRNFTKKGRWTAAIVFAAVLVAIFAGKTMILAEETQTDRYEATVITLSDSGSTISGTGATADGNRIAITDGGAYEISGSLYDGQIYVKADSDEVITLILEGMSIVNQTEAAVYIEQAASVCLELAPGTDNLIQSGSSMPEKVDENASGGALFARNDLIITGEGSLTVKGYIKDGIHENDSLSIEGGVITAEAANHAVKANDSLHVSGGELSLISGADGLHSEGDLTVDGGDIRISSGDDGIHADTVLTVNDGTIRILESYEGLEGNLVHINGGSISVCASDDGINAYGGLNNFGMGMHMSWDSRKTDNTEDTMDPELIIEDGSIYINAGGDGLDSNGDLIINGGFVMIDGPENSMNGALDSGRENGGVCLVNGGTVMAIGAAGMAESFSSASKQNSFSLTVSPSEPGTKILIEDASGNGIFSCSSAKKFSSIVFSSPELETGKAYTVSVGNETMTFTQNAGTTIQYFQ